MTPRFTVVIPTFGRPDRLLQCLRAVEALDYPAFDVVVADDGSPDPVEPAVMRETWRMPVSVVRQRNAGSGAARNLAARDATGDYLAFTADDCTPDTDWLARFAETFARPAHDRAMIGGAIRHGLPGDLCATASHLLIDYLCESFNRETPSFFTPNNLAVHAESFRDAGGFDDTIGATGEDREFCARWLTAGRPLGFEPRAVVEHTHPLSLSAFVRQQYAYGVGSARYRARHRGRFPEPSHPGPAAPPAHRAKAVDPRLMPAPLGFYWRLVTRPLRTEHGARAYWLSALMVLSQLANAAGVVIEASREDSA